MASPKDAARLVKGLTVTLAHKLSNATPVMKDPIAIFSADWLSKTFDMNTLVLIRHPAAFCSSLKLKGWSLDFAGFLNQPLLMDRYLKEFEGDMRECAANNADIIDQGILAWNCIHSTISSYKKEHPEWLFVKHEDISKNPVPMFERIYGALGLGFTSRAQKAIRETTGAHNSAEQQAGDEFVRDSKRNVLNWKRRLTKEQIAKIKSGTEQVASEFYTDSDW